MDYPRLDRTKFKIQSFQEADDQLNYWLTKTPMERLQAAFYLISVAWDFDFYDPPRMDKLKFSVRKHS
ncbi:MAG: hypothetical protein R2788_04855 [Saprospiraceae bacterium]